MMVSVAVTWVVVVVGDVVVAFDTKIVRPVVVVVVVVVVVIHKAHAELEDLSPGLFDASLRRLDTVMNGVVECSPCAYVQVGMGITLAQCY